MAIFLQITSVSALEIDEKLTLRFLKVSTSKKTVLINRGGEDGLVVGDHAKFFITAGVVARGIAEKVSPSRSVWSLYRIVDSEEIVEDKVLNLKIATPVKITNDPTRSLKEEAIPGGDEKMDLETSSVDSSERGSEEDEGELKDISDKNDDQEIATLKLKKSNKKEKRNKITANLEEEKNFSNDNNAQTWEVWGTLAMNSLSGTTTGDVTSQASTARTAIDLSVGLEKYFFTVNNFLKDLSLSLLIHKLSMEDSASITSKSKTSLLEYGGAVNYHFYNPPNAFNKLIGFGTLSFGKGAATLNDSLKGDTTFVAGGMGLKYILTNGFGVRGVLDYYKTTETYTFENGSDVGSLSGARIQLGLSYRF